MPQKQKATFASLPKEVRADRRRLAFRKLDDGWDKLEVADLVEVHLKTMESWLRNRKTLEKSGYHGKKRGNPNDQKLLSDARQTEIISAIKDTLPEKHNIAYHLWSRRAIAEYVKSKYGLTISPRRISVYTKIWGFTPQRPKKQASEQDPQKIKKWLEKDYPKIIERAKKENAEIHWGDETGLNINTNYQKTYAPKGKTPIVKIPAKKTAYSMISSFTNQGKLRYMAYKGGMNAILFKIFLQRLVKDTDKKVFLIVDNLKVHHAKIIQKWQENHKKEIEIFFPAPIFSPRKSR
jgi:transposase